MNALNEILKMQAMKNGLCEQWTSEWDHDCSNDELMEKYKKGLDFCIRHDFPNGEFIKDNFSEAFLRRHHVYVGMDVVDGDFNGTAVVQNGSIGEMHFGGYNAVTVFVRHDSEVLISGCGHAYVMVRVYDNAHVTLEQSGNAKVIVRKHSAESTVIKTGDVKEIGKA